LTPTSIEVAKHTLVSGGSILAIGTLAGARLCDAGRPRNKAGFSALHTRRGARMKTCPECNGDGVIEKGTDDEQQCPTCGGTGLVPDDADGKTNEEVIRTGREVAA
jgi:hypothetical protein